LITGAGEADKTSNVDVTTSFSKFFQGRKYFAVRIKVTASFYPRFGQMTRNGKENSTQPVLSF
jgi:hypothetical protein